MDWSKVDAGLAGALADAGDDEVQRLAVFIHLDAEGADRSFLAALDLEPPEKGAVCTAALSPADLDRLTEQPWVVRVRLSGPLRLMGD